MRRRVGRARVTELVVLDLTDPAVRKQLGIAEEELIDGILAPSGALDGESTLAIFPGGMAKVVAEHSRVQRPPVRMLDVLTRIHVPDALIDSVGPLYAALAALGRRLRRR